MHLDSRRALIIPSSSLIILFIVSIASVNSNSIAFAQYYGGGEEPLTQEELDKCQQYEITPCTRNAILAKERLIEAQGGEKIYLTAISTGNRTGNHFEARIAWTPAELGQPNKFHVEIFDANQLEPRSPLSIRYDIKIYQGDKYLRPAEPTGNEAVQNEDFSHDYTFVFLQEGSYTLAIEEIQAEGENIRIPIQVTPEFPIVIPIVGLAITFVILVSRSMKLQLP